MIFILSIRFDTGREQILLADTYPNKEKLLYIASRWDKDVLGYPIITLWNNGYVVDVQSFLSISQTDKLFEWLLSKYQDLNKPTY